MKNSKRIFFVFVLLIVSFSITITVLAASANGGTISITYNGRTYATYNTITTTSSSASAGTFISCNVACDAGKIGVYPRLQDHNHYLIKTVGWIANSTNNCSSMSATTGSHWATSGTFYSAGQSGPMLNGYPVTVFETPISPPLAIGRTSITETNQISVYGVNSQGQTYGVITNATQREEYPDLIGAVGIDGTRGYVLASELFVQPFPYFESSEDVTEFMTSKERIQGRMIDLYADDGTTIIGKFLADCLIGVTVCENGITRSYNADGTILEIYSDGTEKIMSWK